ncbi:hypothetical protein B0F90DRAFT_1682132 [Multifurca ochricompacta]|uniref:DUF6593 domain-containing protein n=1 Tax=Multifurca ochricompacta TaxID=376703 RepID=A0AAD4MDH9_9AGAM|nr:hypothetical protein B0F90DRAFT_1682132 [Multifurca ochricompacta]
MPLPNKAEPDRRMVFTTNSLRNTTISVEDDTLYYEIVTRFWHPHLTKIFKLDEDTRGLILIAEIEREPGKDVRVRFGGEHGEWINEKDFMSWDFRKRGAVFTGGEGVEYRWKSHRRRLQLVRANDDAKVPLIQYHSYRRHFFIFRMSRHAFLEIKPEANTEGLDKWIVSYLLVERRRRNT